MRTYENHEFWVTPVEPAMTLMEAELATDLPPPADPGPDWTGGSLGVALQSRLNDRQSANDAWEASNPLPVSPPPEEAP